MKKLLLLNPWGGKNKATKKLPKSTSEILGTSGVITIVDRALNRALNTDAKKDEKK